MVASIFVIAVLSCVQSALPREVTSSVRASADAQVATSTLTTAQRTQLPLGIAASVAAVLALFASVAGLNRRLVEYV